MSNEYLSVKDNWDSCRMCIISTECVKVVYDTSPKTTIRVAYDGSLFDGLRL
jgi:hypothetical protein